MNLNPLYILLTLLILALAYITYLKVSRVPVIINKDFIEATIAGKTYQLEVAATEEKRRTGLMNRSELSQDTGMIFVFDGTGLYPFWMKNTLIPLDMIWVNEAKEVVFIKEDAQPCENIVEAVCKSIIPTKSALYVIELNAGEVQKVGLKVGDKIGFELQ